MKAIFFAITGCFASQISDIPLSLSNAGGLQLSSKNFAIGTPFQRTPEPVNYALDTTLSNNFITSLECIIYPC